MTGEDRATHGAGAAVKVVGRVALLIVLACNDDAVGAEEKTHSRGYVRWRKWRRIG